ncbi:hypothetical protein Lser_V15G29997 [Lactuca serriola]
MESFLEEFQHLKIQLEQIKSATNNFHNSNIIGKGGFGEVFKGLYSHSKGRQVVAFKRLDRRLGQGDPEFLKEILMLSRYTHENLISLLGFCNEDGEKILVYEHASNGSLDRHLSSTTLTWRQRLKICLGAARGLCYLHEPKETHQRVIHRDIKSSNILLDENWNAKISDMGLSKIGPANQKHTFLATNVVGTPGYIDPLYMHTYSLTKESDVYSFGVVLFEVLSGRLSFNYNNGSFVSFVKRWKQSYMQKKLDDIIFQDMKKDMDPRSLETFSGIAYQCLQEYREQRPKMSHVVEQLEIALRLQEISEEPSIEYQEIDYKELIKSATTPVVYTSEEKLKMILSKGILVNGGKTRFWLNKNGQHCEMISAAGCLIPIKPPSPKNYCRRKSRFNMDYSIPYCYKSKLQVRTQFLSPHITYTVNLVFDFDYPIHNYFGINYILAGETKSSTVYLVDERKDGWLMAELYHFTIDKRRIDFDITFECGAPLAVEGIEFLPVERVEYQVLEDEEVDMQTMSLTDINYWKQKFPSDYEDRYWERKLPSDYKEIINSSKYIMRWTTMKELYSIFCKGFPIDDGEEWFSMTKNGKKLHMLSPRSCLQEGEWRWQSSPESRFGEVAYDPPSSFLLNCTSRMKTSWRTFAGYLVYKVQENHSAFESPIVVNDWYCSWYIYLLCPQIPIIKSKAYHNSHNTLNSPKKKGLPQQRMDGWMEVQLWESKWNCRLTFSNDAFLKGLIVQGIEVRPI